MMANSRMLRAVVMVILTLTVMPLLVVVGVSFNPSSRFVVATTSFSLRWYHALFASHEYMASLFLVSLPVALSAAALATMVGSLAAIAMVRARIVGRDVVEAVFMIPVLIPSILLGLALYLFFARLGFVSGFAGLVIGHMLLGIPFVIRVVVAGLATIDPRLEEAAVSLGCNRFAAFRRVVVPLLRSSVLSGAIFAFILSFSDVNVALFVAGPGSTTLPLQIFSDIQWQGDPTIAAASTIQIVVVTALIAAAQRLTRARPMA